MQFKRFCTFHLSNFQMKQFLSFLFLMLSAAMVSQGQSNRTFLVLYQKQVNADSLSIFFRQNRTSADERSRITLNVLKQISASSGSELEQFLLDASFVKSGPEIKFTKNWIVNSVTVYAPASFAGQMANYPGVASVEDVTFLKAYHIAPVKMVEDSPNRSVGGVEPGLLAVGARFLWDLGYTGKGLKLMSFDTGIWPSHPALGGRFYGEYMPLHLAWNGIFSPTPVDKGNSHGTHTIGTMSGLDTLTHDTIGLAFKAYSMATDPIVPNLADTIGMVNLMIAYQWVLDPDGNPNTTDDMPAVICNSWGTNGTPGFCGSFVADMLETIDLTGIANEYSAGNEGPGASSTGVPALVNPGIVNAFAVGAINGNVANYPIAPFSSRGPTTCASNGSLLIKPEVVAPGVSVRSCIKTDQYAFYDGTSMAGPHAAGLLLLLKEAFPTVAGETLKEALYYSAIDLGDPGEDNTYGMGIINAEAAYNWLVTEGYTPVSPASTLPELALEKAPAGLLEVVCGNIEQTIYLYNEGSVNISDTVYFKVQFNGNIVAQWAEYIQLSPSQRLQINHPLNLIPQTGANELWISAHQKMTPNEKDMVNNNRTVRFMKYDEKMVPYYENFETDSLKNVQWTVINPDMARTFEMANAGGQNIGTKSVGMRFFIYTPAANQVDWLVSPPVKLEASGNHKAAFDIAYQVKNQTQKDTISLLASLDCGLTFSEVIFTGSPAQMATLNATTPANFTPSLPEHWKRLTFDLPTAWNGQTVFFAFRSVNNKGANAYLDDFSVFIDYDPLTVKENEELKISVFPNPFTEQITVQLDKASDMVYLNLFDLSGRKVAEKSQANTSSVQFSPNQSLPPGVYFLRINTGNGQSVYKLIKR
jgi:subtilisin family serine protease